MKTKINFRWYVLRESLKEPARLAVLAVVAWILTAIVPQLDEKWIPVLTAVLRWVDKWIYQYGKTIGNDKLIGGLTRF